MSFERLQLKCDEVRVSGRESSSVCIGKPRKWPSCAELCCTKYGFPSACAMHGVSYIKSLSWETDEHAHGGYNRKDQADRYHDIMMVHQGPMVFIRFNADSQGSCLNEKLENVFYSVK